MLYRRSFELPPINHEEAAVAGGLYAATCAELIEQGGVDAVIGKKATISMFDERDAFTAWVMHGDTRGVPYDVVLWLGVPRDPDDLGLVCQYEKGNNEAFVRRRDHDNPLSGLSLTELSLALEKDGSMRQAAMARAASRRLERSIGTNDQPVGMEEVAGLRELLLGGTVLRLGEDE